MRHSRLISRRRAVPAFTLTEMLLVMAVLGTLLALVMPLFGHAIEISRSAKCKSNLHSITSVLHTEDGRSLGLPGGSVHTIPTANRWSDFVFDRNLNKLLLCPSNTLEHDDLWGLRRLWVRQDGYTGSQNPYIHYTNFQSLLSGGEIADWQVAALYQGTTYGSTYQGWDWVQELNDGQPPEDNEAFIVIATCAAFKVTLQGNYSVITSLGHATNWSTGSDHWVVKGDPNEDTWENDVIVRLTGVSNSAVFPPVRVYNDECHYGMSNLVPVRNFSMTQLWLTEYTDEVMRLSSYHRDDPFDDNLENGEVLDRHLGFANCAKVDGSVFHMSKAELETEFDNLDVSENIFQK